MNAMTTDRLTIAILGGAGKEGGGLAMRWANAGHRIIIGSRDGIQETIDHLCKLHFCDHADWSRICPKHDSPGDCFSIMSKWRI